jgi:hypothetical protein
MPGRKTPAILLALLFVVCVVSGSVAAQDAGTVLTGAELTHVTPPGFYFEGQSAPTQMRNTAAARFGADRYVIAGLVDTSGYAADVKEKYQGFLITDSPIKVGGSALGTGAYGFGFLGDGKFVVLDLGGKIIMSMAASPDKELKRPRPLMMLNSADGIRLYSGRSYVNIAAN